MAFYQNTILIDGNFRQAAGKQAVMVSLQRFRRSGRGCLDFPRVGGGNGNQKRQQQSMKRRSACDVGLEILGAEHDGWAKGVFHNSRADGARAVDGSYA